MEHNYLLVTNKGSFQSTSSAPLVHASNATHGKQCDCQNCKQTTFAKRVKDADENANKLIEEEERKKRKAEKKKLQKKKRKEKRKADKEEDQEEEEDDGPDDHEEEIVKPRKTDTNNTCRKAQKSVPVQKEMQTNNSLNMKKLVENMDVKRKKDQLVKESKQSISNKNKNCSKNTAKHKQASMSTSQQKEDESEHTHEEEELNFESAFAQQIAQRKTRTASHNKIESPFVASQYIIDFSADLTENESEFNDSSQQNQDGSMKSEKELNSRKSIDIGAKANKKAYEEDYKDAIELFTEAIELNPCEYRFYVNRSYCFDCLSEYESALKDAERSISLNPLWPKCYYRKGRALAGLGRYEDAERAFKKVIELEDDDCVEAKTELLQVRIDAIIRLGYEKQVAVTAAKKFNSVKESIYAVVNGLINTKGAPILSNRSGVLNNNRISYESGDSLFMHDKQNYLFEDDDIYFSDEDVDQGFGTAHEANKIDSQQNDTTQGKIPDVTNPFNWKALWIGNLSPVAKQAVLEKMFSKFGKLTHCGVYKKSSGAFALVHYDNGEAPREAMSYYQGSVIRGLSKDNIEPLVIRFRPNRDQRREKYQERLDIEECYYWRTTGCHRGENCHFKHIPANKGVDIQPWMNAGSGRSDNKPRNKVKPK